MEIKIETNVTVIKLVTFTKPKLESWANSRFKSNLFTFLDRIDGLKSCSTSEAENVYVAEFETTISNEELTLQVTNAYNSAIELASVVTS